MTDNLAPPGSSSYTSNTMHVGDGTWDKTTDTFLLPNLQGLNLATTQYNGMANRFKGDSQYHTYILGHGVLAAITFIGILPLAIFLAKYGHDWPGGRVSFKLHVYLQIVTVFLSTVILVLGWFAVGPERSLSNPHHGIGVAIYVLILFQFLYGSCWFRRERKRSTPPIKLPLTVWLHRLLGRTTALLAFIEIGLGLTLYGSPKSLFILYALAGAFLLFLYLALDYYYMPRSDGTRPGRGQPDFYSDYGSYVSGSNAQPPKKGHHWGRDLLAAGGVVGAYEWFKHRRDRRREDRDSRYDDESAVSRPGPSSMGPSTGPPMAPIAQPSFGPPQPGPPQPGPPPMGPPQMGPPPMMSGARSGRPMSQSGVSRASWEDEKYTDQSYRPTWRERMLEATGAYAAYDGARALFSRRRRRDDDYEDGHYGSALGGNVDMVSQADVSRVAAGQAPESPATPRVNMGGPQPMTPTTTPSRPPRGGPRPHSGPGGNAPLSEHVRDLGPIAGLRAWNEQRRNRRDADRAEDERRQELEDQYHRRSSNHYPRPQDAMQRRPSLSGTHMTGPSAQGAVNSDMGRANVGPDTTNPPLPAAAGTLPPSSQAPLSRQNVAADPGYTLPPPPPGPPPPNVIRSDGYGSRPDFGSAQMPEGAVNPDPRRLVQDNTAANESSAYGRDPAVRGDVVAAAAAGAVGAVAASTAMDSRGGVSESPTRAQGSRDRLPRQSGRGSTTSASVYSNGGAAGPSRPSNPNSPPVSVKVKMHNDGRHVTLRRLNEQEAAAERENRRQDRRRRRASSLSSGADDGPSQGGQRYRRNGGGIRTSSEQPITNIPPIPPMSSSAGASFRRESELNLPPAQAPMGPPAAAPQQQQPSPAFYAPQQQPSPALNVPQQQSSPASNTVSPPAPPMNESGLGYNTDGGTGTDVSAFDSNRRRRRAERARRAEAARSGGGGGGGGGRVEFG